MTFWSGQKQRVDEGDGQSEGSIGRYHCVECGPIITHGANEVGDGDQQQVVLLLVEFLWPVRILVQLGQDLGGHLLPVRNSDHPRSVWEEENKQHCRRYQESPQ